MTTPLTKIYDVFLSKVSDYKFINLNEEGMLEDYLLKYLKSAIVRFPNSEKPLNYDEKNQIMIETLDDFEIEILATLMTLNYITSKQLHVKNMELTMSDRDYKLYSEEKHLQQLTNVKKSIHAEASQLMTSYSLRNGL